MAVQAVWLPNLRSVPRCHLQLATVQVEGCKMPSNGICELPQGSAPGRRVRRLNCHLKVPALAGFNAALAIVLPVQGNWQGEKISY